LGSLFESKGVCASVRKLSVFVVVGEVWGEVGVLLNHLLKYDLFGFFVGQKTKKQKKNTLWDKDFFLVTIFLVSLEKYLQKK